MTTWYFLIIFLSNPATGVKEQHDSYPMIYNLSDCRKNAKTLGKALHDKEPDLNVLIVCRKVVDKPVNSS